MIMADVSFSWVEKLAEPLLHIRRSASARQGESRPNAKSAHVPVPFTHVPVPFTRIPLFRRLPLLAKPGQSGQQGVQVLGRITVQDRA